MKQGKGIIRSLVRGGADDGKVHPAEARLGRRSEPVICDRCGAMLQRRRWQRPSARPTHDLLGRAEWGVCPACEQQARQEYQGRIVIDGDILQAGEGPIRRRIHNVAERAEFTQVEHRVVSIERVDGPLEVLTTSQKLAHRIVHELKKAFGGRATYRWLDDGCLQARWRAGAIRAAEVEERR